MKKTVIIMALFFNSFLFSYYQVGDTISIADQSYPLSVCYGDYLNDTLKLADFNSDITGEQDKVIFFRFTASWWGPSCAEVPYFDAFHFIFENQPVVIFENIDDLNQPYSCEEWGEFGEEGIPILTTDENSPYFFYLFGNSYTWSVVLGPDMVVKYSSPGSIAPDIIQNILNEYNLGPVLGDQNQDGLVDILDAVQVINLVLEGEYQISADLNYDEIINIQDVIILISIILE